MQRIQKKTPQAKAQEFAKLIILVVGIICGGYYLSQNLFPKVMVAHASTGKEIFQTDGSKSKNQKIRTYSPQGWFKIYLGSAPIKVIFDPPAGEAGSSRWIANQKEIRNWITIESNGTITVNPSSFVNSIASQVNIPASQDQDGRGVDTNNLTNQINDVLASGRRNQTIALVTTVVHANAQAGRYNGRYVDINLSEQTLYAFDGFNLVNQFLVSTGRSGYDTPTGEFHVYGKDHSARMHGPGYYLPNVPYISWFLGDYSIHGTYWHNNFGHVMSHGCVNASTGDAEWLFGWADIGTPVYIHY